MSCKRLKDLFNRNLILLPFLFATSACGGLRNVIMALKHLVKECVVRGTNNQCRKIVVAIADCQTLTCYYVIYFAEAKAMAEAQLNNLKGMAGDKCSIQ